MTTRHISADQLFLPNGEINVDLLWDEVFSNPHAICLIVTSINIPQERKLRQYWDGFYHGDELIIRRNRILTTQ